MNGFLKILLACLFGVILLLIYGLLRLDKITDISGVGLLALAIAAGGVYYYLFERKKRR